MKLPYDEDYLREMELWPFFAMSQQSLQISIIPTVIAEDATPVPPVALRPQTARPSSSPHAVQSTTYFAPPDPERAARIAKLDWDALKIEAATCKACGLCKQRKQAVLGVGAPEAPWLFVGEGPGGEEDDQGEPFVGPAGKLLDAMLAATGLRRGREVYIANVVKCRPPGNRNPSAEEALACAPLLDRQIDLVQPKLVVALGKIALTRLTGSDASMASMRGKRHEYRGIPVIATYHPAYLLRNLPDKLKAWEDLMLAKKTMASL